MLNPFKKTAPERSCKDRQARERVEGMRTMPGGRTRSVSNQMKAKPDAYTRGLQKRAERGDTAAAQQLAQHWKKNHG
jgi:hypothetical protein